MSQRSLPALLLLAIVAAGCASQHGMGMGGASQGPFGARSLQCPPAMLHTEPLGEKHANYIGRRGAQVLVLQPDHDQEDMFASCTPFLGRIQQFQDAAVQGLGWRIARELRTPDGVTPMAVEGLALELLAVAARLERPSAFEPVPRWLVRAEELLRSACIPRTWRAPFARDTTSRSRPSCGAYGSNGPPAGWRPASFRSRPWLWRPDSPTRAT